MIDLCNSCQLQILIFPFAFSGSMEDNSSPEICALRVLDAVPVVMRFIRAEMRSKRARGVSVPQFRSMAFLRTNEGASLSQVTEHVGLSMPAMSRLVDGLVRRGLLARDSSASDRRRVTLRLTTRGQDMIRAARKWTLQRLAGVLENLPKDQRSEIAGAMTVLKSIFTQRAHRADGR
jgi:DNA-binding MarR family transcriptional regulator